MDVRRAGPILLGCCGWGAALPATPAARSQDTLTFVSVSAGASHTCALTAGRRAYCWGDNSEGELGSGEPTPSPNPIAVAGDLTFLMIDAGVEFTCGVTTSGEAYCWGRNNTGALGNAATPRSLVPVPVTGGLLFRSVATGDDHACGLADGGRAYCWGANGDGQLGIRDTGSSFRPLPITGEWRFHSLTAGGAHSCGVTVDSLAFCWGSNRLGQLGTGRRASSFVPRPVAHARRWRMLSAGAEHTCGLTADRHPAVFCWGSNFHGQGAGPFTNWSPSLAADAPFIVGVDAGRRHTCIVRQVDNAVRCFGSNLDDQLGRDVFGPYSQVSAGAAHTCALRADGVLMCWGRNAAGQLGNGSQYSEARPVRVVEPAAFHP